MIRRATVRLPVAVLITAVCAILAVLAGRPDAAVLAAPWAVLLAMGLSGTRQPTVVGSVGAEARRVVAGDSFEVVTRISGATGWVEVGLRPDARFWPDAPPTTDSAGDVAPPGAVRPVADVADGHRFTELQSELIAAAWGSHDVGRVDLTVNEPFGLIQWTGSLHTPTTVRVHPKPVDLQRLLAPWFVRRLSGAHGSRTVGRGVEYADIRPFSAGDSLRDINWPASARSDDLIVSQRHPDRSTDVVLLVDTFTESGHDMRSILGLAIEAAVGLAESHLSVTDRVGLIELGGIVRWVNPGTGRHQLQRLTDALLATELYENAADRHVMIVPPKALPPRSFVIALSPLLDPRFVDSLSVLRAGGHDVSVIECPPITDPSVETEFRSKGDTARLASLLWQAERNVTRDRLTEAGIAVGRWELGDHIDLVLADLARRRLGTRTGTRR